ncbi:MAG TPA: XRE family transcriptional regulator [Candidatus Elarobacter sp.]|jgi:transcriptional regulator with XRE-family HTH domain|nr:XRE family transcriptional regulator [Candidatus Elarobacter sp.]
MPPRSRAVRVNEEGEPAYRGAPDIGRILKRMRIGRKLSIRDVAAGSGLSASFLSAVERGESDVSIGRLARIAEFFDQDLGSMLGYSTALARPNFVGKTDRTVRNRGRGIRYELMRLPGLNLELAVMMFEARTAMRDELSHEGVDALYVVSGDIVLRVNDVDYPMKAGECAVYSAAYAHTLRNDAGRPAAAVGVTTARM